MNEYLEIIKTTLNEKEYVEFEDESFKCIIAAATSMAMQIAKLEKELEKFKDLCAEKNGQIERLKFMKRDSEGAIAENVKYWEVK